MFQSEISEITLMTKSLNTVIYCYGLCIHTLQLPKRRKHLYEPHVKLKGVISLKIRVQNGMDAVNYSANTQPAF